MDKQLIELENRIIFEIGAEISRLGQQFGPIANAPEILRAKICVQYLLWMTRRGLNSARIVGALLKMLAITPYTLNKYYIDERDERPLNLRLIGFEFGMLVPPVTTIIDHQNGQTDDIEAMALTLMSAIFECRTFGDNDNSVAVWALTHKKEPAYRVAKYWQDNQGVNTVYEMILALSASNMRFN